MGKRLGAVLKSARKRKGVSQQKLVARIELEHGVSIRQPRMSEYECGRKEPTEIELRCILESLGYEPKGRNADG
tara:strand:- start:1417 stop:1638 length:222 start_codon:yes stop_codon:yes gene_type:complete